MLIFNKKAKFNYNLLEKIEAGVVLTGWELKSVVKNNVDLGNAYVKIISGEVYLVNANIPGENINNYNPTRSRKLLLHKKEVVSIETKIKAKKLTLVPTKMYNRHGKVKVEIALAKAKRRYEKRESVKRSDIEREAEKELVDKYR